MSQPSPYQRTFSFTNFQAQNPALALPGSQVDLELNNAKATLDAVLANLKLIQRDDGGVKNASIGLDQLKSEVPIGFNAPVVWTTATTYVAGSSTVFNGSGFYRCLVTHTSGVFATDLAALKWQLIVNLAAVPLVAANQIAVTPSGLLTTDAQTSLQALDTGKAPLSHTHVSSTISDSTAAGRALLTAADVAAQNALLGTTLLGFQSGDIKETAVLVLPSGWYYCDGSSKNRVTDINLFNAITIQQSGVLTSGSAIVTGLSDTSNGGSTPMSPGMPISGTGVPANTVIQSVDSGTQITMSANATAAVTAALVFAPYGVGDGSTTFGLPNRAYVGVGRDNASGSASNVIQVPTSVTTVSGSPSVAFSSTSGVCVGMYVSSPKIPFGAQIVSISGSTVVLSANALATAGPLAATCSPIRNAQTMGATGGALSQSTTLVAANLPPITSSGTFTTSAAVVTAPVTGFGLTTFSANAGSQVWQAFSNGAILISATPTATGNVTSTGTNSTPFKTETFQPTTVMNYIIKR